MIITQRSTQTKEGDQLTVLFSVTDYEGVDPNTINMVTASFYDSSNNELFQYDVTGETQVTVSITKDQSIRCVISYTTDSQEYESAAHYALKRFAVYKRSKLIEQNKAYKTQQVTRILSDVQAMLEDAIYIHQQGKRVQYDREIADINKLLDSALHC